MRQGKRFGKKTGDSKVYACSDINPGEVLIYDNVLGVRKKTFGQLLPIMTNSRLEPEKTFSQFSPEKISMAEKLPFSAKNHLEILFLLDHVPSQVYLKNCKQLSYISEFYSVSSSVCYW